MMEARLRAQLDALARTLREARLARWLAVSLAGATALGLFLLAFHLRFWWAPLAAGVIAAGFAFARQHGKSDDLSQLLREIEPRSPAVRHLLTAAAEQAPVSGSFNFLQWRVIEEALSHPRREEWQRRARGRLRRAQTAGALALLAWIGVVLALQHRQTNGAAGAGWLAAAASIDVTPGDTNVERGTALVIAARFGGAPPPEAALVFQTTAGKEQRLNMARRLADPVFGASIPELSEPGTYHIEYAGKKTRDYTLGVFDYPALARADASVRYPAYTGLTNQTILDTRRVSAVEGSRLSYTLQLNKPVLRARWVGQGRSLPLLTSTNATASLPDFLLTNSATYRLELVDADGRSNKFPIDFVLQALTNQRPVVRLVFPRGDPRVSRLEELLLQAEASDDFGLLKYGFGFGVAGQEPRFVELGQTAPANAKRQFDYLISLERMDVDVDQSVSYFAWADDYGPDGRERRTFSDIFFADVRPFDEVFRADQSGADESQGAAQGGGGDERVKLAEMQKQIVIATWNLEKTGADSLPQP